MARGWGFVGGLMIVTTITYMNLTTIGVVAKNIQASLIREQKKLENARNAQTSGEPSQPTIAASIKWASPGRVADRIKKIWNEDIERSARRIQNTDWERMGQAVESHMKRARERMASSWERMGSGDSKKDSSSTSS